MKLQIKTRGVVVTKALRDLAERRIRAALSRFVNTVRTVDLTLTDVNGPRGGIDKLARLHIAGHGFLPIVIEQSDREAGRAIAFAIERGARSLVRALDRGRAGLAPLATDRS
jgi:ribosome-associated translation inhibitor RaiA